jgi:hypothetical protein
MHVVTDNLRMANMNNPPLHSGILIHDEDGQMPDLTPEAFIESAQRRVRINLEYLDGRRQSEGKTNLTLEGGG